MLIEKWRHRDLSSLLIPLNRRPPLPIMEGTPRRSTRARSRVTARRRQDPRAAVVPALYLTAPFVAVFQKFYRSLGVRFQWWAMASGIRISDWARNSH